MRLAVINILSFDSWTIRPFFEPTKIGLMNECFHIPRSCPIVLLLPWRAEATKPTLQITEMQREGRFGSPFHTQYALQFRGAHKPYTLLYSFAHTDLAIVYKARLTPNNANAHNSTVAYRACAISRPRKQRMRDTRYQASVSPLTPPTPYQK